MIQVLGVGHFVPEKIVTNHDLSVGLDTSDEWIASRTGIRERHIAPPDMRNADLATAALLHALRNAQLESNDLDGIILATTTPDLFMPATAAKVQQNIGMCHGFAFDIQAVCTGFLYALNIGYSMIKAGQARKIAVIGSELMSRIVDWQDRSTCVLFGDGAGAVILGDDDATDRGIIGIDIYADGRYIDMLKVSGGISSGNLEAKLQMVGAEVYRFAIEKMSSSLMKILEKLHLTADQLDWIVPHQANDRIIRSLSKVMNVAYEKFVVTVDRHANTSAASIPLALSVYIENNIIKAGDLLALSAVGSGMTWGSAVLRL